MTGPRGAPAPRGIPAHLAAVLVGVALCAGFVATDGWARGVVMALASGAPATLVLFKLVRRELPGPRPWWWLAGGLTLLTVNGIAWWVEVGVEGHAVAQGPVATWSLPLGYAMLLVGAVLMLLPFADEDGGELLDAGVLWLACASLLWVVLVHPTLVRQHVGGGARLYTLVVILLVSGLAGMVLRTAIAHRGARPALLYMSGSVLLTLLGNVARELTRDSADGSSAEWLGLVWILAYGGIAAAALHPSHAHIPVRVDAADRESARLSRGRLWAFGMAVGLNPVLAGLQRADSGDVDWMLLTLSTLAIVPMVVVRIARLADRGERAEHALVHLATHDELTGLPNRRAMTAHLTGALTRLRAGASPGVTIAFLDIDALKVVNDAHGHAAGDMLIQTVGARVSQAVGRQALVARFGGDEFVVVATTTRQDGETLVGAVRGALTGQVEATPGTWVRAGASVGVRHVRPDEVVTAQQVLAEADAQMYTDKRSRALA